MGSLTVRGRLERADGLEPWQRGSVWPSPANPAANQIILLVHGYNNTESVARESYRQLKEKLAEASVNPVALENIWEVYWPGFEPRWVTLLPRDQDAVWYSVATYSKQVPKAAAAGEQLGIYLSRLASRPSIVLVAHSLGCRVALEAFREMEEHGHGGRVVAFCLMAAAVPTHMADENGRLRAAAKLGVSVILWSSRDWVLKYAFPFGQRIAARADAREEIAGEGRRCTAVGLTGLPLNVWKAQHQTDLGHSGYYRKASNYRYWFHASKDTWPYLAPLFGRATDKPLPEIQLAPWRAPTEHRQSCVQLPEREVSSRLRKLLGKFV